MGSGRGITNRVALRTLFTHDFRASLPRGFATVPQEEALTKLARFLQIARHGSWLEKDLVEDVVVDLEDELKSYGMKIFGGGRARSVYKLPQHVVIKIPVSAAAGTDYPLFNRLTSNPLEYAVAQHEFPTLRIARTQLLWHASGLPVILQEEVETDLRADKLPDWAGIVEGKQVGRSYLSGAVVAYDLDSGPLGEVPVGVDPATKTWEWLGTLQLPIPDVG